MLTSGFKLHWHWYAAGIVNMLTLCSLTYCLSLWRKLCHFLFWKVSLKKQAKYNKIKPISKALIKPDMSRILAIASTAYYENEK